MKIIVDAFGGDNAPKAVLEGASLAVKELGVEPQNGMATGLNIQTHLEKKVCQSEWSVLVAWSVVQCGSSEKGT